MTDDCKFKVGDRVTKVGWRDIYAVLTVEKISRSTKCIHLSDGSKWEWSGLRPHGYRSSYTGTIYSGPSIRAWEQGDEDAVEKRDLLESILSSNKDTWSQLSLSDLRSVATMLHAAKDRRAAKGK